MRIKCDDCQAVSINGRPSHETGCHGTFTFIKGSKIYRLFSVWSLDAWGNAREGFEVNDRSKLGVIMLEGLTDHKIIAGLKRAGYLYKLAKNKSFQIDGDETVLHIEHKGIPVMQLEAQ